MKRLISTVFAVSFVAVSAFAIDLSAGGMFNITPTGDMLKTKIDDFSHKITTSQMMLGFNGFFDAQYVNLALGINGTVGKQKYTEEANTPRGNSSGSENLDISTVYFNIGIFGKYPFQVSIAKLYPIVGFDFDLPVSAKIGSVKITEKEHLDMLHRYWFDLGFGADVFVAGKLFIRPQAVFGIQMNTPKAVKDMISAIKDAGGKASAFGWKFNLGIGIGYQFL